MLCQQHEVEATISIVYVHVCAEYEICCPKTKQCVLARLHMIHIVLFL